MIKLLQMFSSAASNVTPARKVLAGWLLNEEGHWVEQELEKVLKGKYCSNLVNSPSCVMHDTGSELTESPYLVVTCDICSKFLLRS